MLLRVQQALRRDEFENLDGIADRPAMRGCARTQLSLRLRQSDVKSPLMRLAPSNKKRSAIVVLPVPGLPSRRNICPVARPPAKISSSPAMPVAALTDWALLMSMAASNCD